jgi:hypothetical protein
MKVGRILRTVALLCCIGPLVAGCITKPIPSDEIALSRRLPAEGRAAFYVRVELKQSLRQIANIYRVPARDIVIANQLKPPYAVQAGELIEVPLAAATMMSHQAKRDRRKRFVGRTNRSKLASHRTHHKGTILNEPAVAALPVPLDEAAIRTSDLTTFGETNENMR